VGAINLVLWIGGAALIWLGYARAHGPWGRYQDLKAQDANVARYEAWRGGVREDSGPTGASVAMALLRRQVQVGAGLGIAGLIAIVAGFVIR
jgi:threonine/homoserine/homoserine lactone efflux protein